MCGFVTVKFRAMIALRRYPCGFALACRNVRKIGLPRAIPLPASWRDGRKLFHRLQRRTAVVCRFIVYSAVHESVLFTTDRTNSAYNVRRYKKKTKKKKR